MTRRRGRRQQTPRRWWRRPRTAVAGAVLVAVAAAAAVVGAIALRSGGGEDEPNVPTAAIIDQLSLTVPNEEFRREATDKLERAGYQVDYFPGEEVTVDFYRHLGDRGYDVIVFRSHADRLSQRAPDGELVEGVVLFTGEPYDRERYTRDQGANRLVIARYQEGGEPYFGIAPGFISDRAGSFDGALIVMMGCEGMLTDTTARAFVEQGASAYISWSETVSAVHTDEATGRLLDHLLLEGKPPAESVEATMAELGPDPFFGSELVAFTGEG